MSKTDFFEFPIGDTYRECIEVETDYERGVMDERKRWEAKRCDTCKWRNCLASEMEPCTNCIRREYFDIEDHYEPKEPA